jgi:hypothetical protein
VFSVNESFLLMFCSNSLGVGSDIYVELANFYGSIILLCIMFFSFLFLMFIELLVE